MIKRLWVGEEVEGTNKGKVTLFVEGEVIDAIDLIPFLEKNNVSRIYFGAGRVNVYAIMNIELIKTYELVGELDQIGLDAADKSVLENLELTGTIRSKNAHYLKFVKYDDYKNVFVNLAQSGEYTDLSNVKDGMYEGVDKVLLDRREI